MLKGISYLSICTIGMQWIINEKKNWRKRLAKGEWKWANWHLMGVRQLVCVCVWLYYFIFHFACLLCLLCTANDRNSKQFYRDDEQRKSQSKNCICCVIIMVNWLDAQWSAWMTIVPTNAIQCNIRYFSSRCRVARVRVMALVRCLMSSWNCSASILFSYLKVHTIRI